MCPPNRQSFDARLPFAKVMGSEAGLTGPKGAIVRKVAVGPSLSNLEEALNSIKGTLERK